MNAIYKQNGTPGKERMDMSKILELLEKDCTLTPAQLAAQAGLDEAQVKAEIARLERDGVILGYQAVVDWDRTRREAVTALIEVKVTPRPHRRAHLSV